jgi:TetR/AcrR family transcriptional regulator, transcriptional repressor for nem operon
MNWPPEHKSATRRRIVEAAAQAYRECGLDGISTAEIMRRVGLTHGGFYAHFPSKDALVAEALATARADTLSEYGKVAASAPAHEKLLAIAETYLSSRHREHPETGCPIAALGSELPRQSGPVREKFGDGVAAQLATLARSVASDDEEARARLAAGTFAAMVGGIILARALSGSNDADRFLEHVRQFVRDALAGTAGSAAAS